MKTNSICLIETVEEKGPVGRLSTAIRSITTFVNNPIGQLEAEREFSRLANEQKYEDENKTSIFSEDEITEGWDTGALSAPTGDGWTLQVVRSNIDRR